MEKEGEGERAEKEGKERGTKEKRWRERESDKGTKEG
jgi:hypothetical protein